MVYSIEYISKACTVYRGLKGPSGEGVGVDLAILVDIKELEELVRRVILHVDAQVSEALLHPLVLERAD